MTDALKSLANLGFTSQGAAIVDSIWFTNSKFSIGMVLICNTVNIWKAYIDAIPTDEITEEEIDAKIIAEYGSKISFDMANAAFPNRFTRENYDVVL